MAGHNAAVIKQRVRSAALPAGIAAALMLYFAYRGGSWTVTGSGVYRVAAWMFIRTLQVGGVAMLLSVLALCSGARPALLYDTVVTMLCGGLFVISGVLQVAGGGGMMPLLYVVFGVMFLSSGWGSWREYSALGLLLERLAAGTDDSAADR